MTEEKRYTCLETGGDRGCGMVFGSWEALKEHEKSHAPLTSNERVARWRGPDAQGIETDWVTLRASDFDRLSSPPETEARPTIIATLAAINPWRWEEDGHNSRYECFFCGLPQNGNRHRPVCLWQRAADELTRLQKKTEGGRP